MSDDFHVSIEPVALKVLPEFLGEPNKALSSPGREWRWGKNGSIAVDCLKNVWADHEDQTGGGVLDLLQSFRGYTKHEAVEWLQDEGFLERRERANGPANGAANGSSPQGKFAGFMDDHPVATFEYHDDRGRLAYEVLKFAKTAPRRYMQRRKHPAGKGWIWGLQGGTYGQVKSGDWFKAKEGKHYQAEETFEDAVRWLYHRDEVLKAKADGRPVYLCYSPDTEVLTSSGWVAFPDLKHGDPVAQYDLETAAVSFAAPHAYQQFDYRGEMVNIRAEWCDLLVTPDHRQASRFYRTGRALTRPQIRPASEIKRGHRLPAAGLSVGKFHVSEIEARITAAWLADGVWEPRGGKVSWNLKKDRKKRRLRELLAAAGIRWSEHTPPSTPGWTGFRVEKHDLSFIWQLAPDKRWPWDAVDWREEARRAALDEIRYWDGDWQGGESFRMFTADRQSADVISAMAAVTGHHANLRVDRREGKNDSYVINLSPRPWRQLSRTPDRVPYSGEVFCCTVPTGLLVVRRNGKVTISGNCEGEKDVETLRAWGFTATTNAGGAKYWSEAFDADLAGADVVILPDNDDAGQQRALMRGAGLMGKAKSVRVLDIAAQWKEAPEKADISAWKEATSATAEQFAALAKRARPWKPERPKSRYGALEWSRLDEPGPELDFLVDGWLTEGERSVIGGPSRSGKSFLAIHMAMCVARGQDFFNWPVKRGGVVYQAGEGARGVKRRLKAYRKHFEVAEDEDVPFVFLGSKVDLYSRDGDTQGLIDEIKAWALTMSVPLRLVVIDTLATATAGADENSGKDMGVVLANIARIADETGAHVMLVHHMNADGKKLRGHTSVYANVDQVVTVVMDEDTKIRTATLSKQKDDEDGLKLTFALASVTVGYSERTQRDITSCVVLSIGEKERLKKEQDRQGFTVGPTERRILMNLFEAVDRHGRFVATDKDGPRAAIGKTVIDWDAYRDVALERMPEITDRKKAADNIRKEFARFKDGLIKYGIIGVSSPHMWWAGRPVRSFPRTFPDGNSAENSGKNAGNLEPGQISPGMAEMVDGGEMLL